MPAKKTTAEGAEQTKTLETAKVAKPAKTVASAKTAASAKGVASAKAVEPAKAAKPAKAVVASAEAPAPAKATKAPPRAKATKAPAPAKAAKAPARPKAAKAAEEEGETAPRAARPRRGGDSALVIVESPAKAKTIKKYLGAGYVVKASVGHVKDLPKTKIGVDIEQRLRARVRGHRRQEEGPRGDQRSGRARVERVYLAPDPDREGEAIAWHLAEEVRDVNPNIQRVLFNEITKKAITEAHRAPDASSTCTSTRRSRRGASSTAWSATRSARCCGTRSSAGCRPGACSRSRCAWSSSARRRSRRSCPRSTGRSTPTVEGERAAAVRGQGREARRQEGRARTTRAQAREIVDELRAAPAAASQRSSARSGARTPPPPFITSKLQQEAARKLRFSAKRTMALAQRLYEGVELGDEGPVGLITYMRTDSTRLSDDALTEVRGVHRRRATAPTFLPAEPIVYKTKKRRRTRTRRSARPR